jgi:PAB-dependent poly(A)-specific ribonuclease subunit 3
MQPWKRVDNANTVIVHDAFTTRAFGDSSLIFVTDYHPCSKTIAETHFQTNATSRFGTTDRYGNPIRIGNPQHVPESTLWAYIVQVASALKTIHAFGLAAQVIHPTKILLTSKNRVRLNACGIMDVVKFEPSQPGVQRSPIPSQQDDFLQFGRLILSIASGSLSVYTTPQNALESLSRSYTERLRDCLGWLLAPSQPQQPKDIDFLLAAISSQAIAVLDNDLHASDSLEGVLATSLEDGRLARLLLKLNLILERPEHDLNPRWSETGERYYVKLFRDYVFHAVDAGGHPNMDLSHIIGCLNRLDVGSDERIMLTSRDGSTCFVVSFKDIKRAIESSWSELLGNSSGAGAAKGRK